MSKTIKVIDLLNKIANGEEIPECVRYFNRISKQFETMLVCKENIIYKLDIDIIDLNDEVEIIEEEPEIDIQAIEERIHNNVLDISKEFAEHMKGIKDVLEKYQETLEELRDQITNK